MNGMVLSFILGENTFLARGLPCGVDWFRDVELTPKKANIPKISTCSYSKCSYDCTPIPEDCTYLPYSMLICVAGSGLPGRAHSIVNDSLNVLFDSRPFQNRVRTAVFFFFDTDCAGDYVPYQYYDSTVQVCLFSFFMQCSAVVASKFQRHLLNAK